MMTWGNEHGQEPQERAPTPLEMQEARAKGTWCAGCGAIDHRVAAAPGEETRYCPRCAQMHQAGDLAVDNLSLLIAGFMPIWKRYWVSRGADARYLGEIVGQLEETLLNSTMRPVITEAFHSDAN